MSSLPATEACIIQLNVDTFATLQRNNLTVPSLRLHTYYGSFLLLCVIDVFLSVQFYGRSGICFVCKW